MFCSKCKNTQVKRKGYCNPCMASYMKQKRKEGTIQDKEYQKSYQKEYRRKTRGTERVRLLRRFHNSLYRARKRGATPTWAELKHIKEFYLDCPQGMQVDHIIPLAGENVCGLHVLDNLQYLTREDNLIKKNSFKIDS